MYFCFDAETDGLYGEAFAIAAVVMDEDGELRASFSGKADVNAVATPWVQEHVLPFIDDLPDYPDRVALREAFWAFWLQYRESCLCLADVHYPVESQLMRQCVEADLSSRQWLGPFPLIDVASVFAAHGFDPLTDRQAFSGFGGRPHHPKDDAIASCLSCIQLLREPDCNNK